MRRDDALFGVYSGSRTRADRLRAPGRGRRGLPAVDEALVAVHPLVGDRADLRRVVQDAGDELLAGRRQLHRVVGVVEGVDVALEQAHVRVHRRARVIAEGLGHERGPDALVDRHLLDEVAEGHHVVGHRQGVGVAQVDLLLARRTLVVGELHRDAHRLQRVDRVAAEVRRGVVDGLVEISAGVGRGRDRAVERRVLEEEELDLRVDEQLKPRSAALFSWRRSTCRESAQLGVPSGIAMSQNMRAEW